MGFIRTQEEKLAARFLRWQHEKQQRPLPPESEILRQAVRIVDEAHRIAKDRGGNLLDIMKELVRDFLKK
jgi:excinuclease UvrABC nuclease subunit